MARAHKGIYQKENPNKPTGTLDAYLVKKSSVLDLCVDIAIKGTPFRFFDSPEVRALTRLAMKGACENAGEVTAAKVRNGVVEKAGKLRSLLKQKLVGRKLSISADFGSRHAVDFLGKILTL